VAKAVSGNRNIKLTIAYDGTAYHGFQRQSNAITVQQILEDKLARIFQSPITVNGSARTDTGVHAYGQVVNFLTAGTIPAERIAVASRGLLPRDIVILAAEDVELDFHARISATGKLYVYRIHRSALADPFLRNYAWHITSPLDVAAMQEAAQVIIGTHDFSAFRGANITQVVSPVRTIFKAEMSQDRDRLEFRVWGNGFLYHMVRNLVGTLVDIGRGRRSGSDMGILLAGKDRSKAGMTAPAQGLYLQEVFYNSTHPGMC